MKRSSECATACYNEPDTHITSSSRPECKAKVLWEVERSIPSVKRKYSVRSTSIVSTLRRSYTYIVVVPVPWMLRVRAVGEVY